MLRKNMYGFMQRLEHSTNTIIRNSYQLWIVRCDIWSSWIKSHLVTISYAALQLCTMLNFSRCTLFALIGLISFLT